MLGDNLDISIGDDGEDDEGASGQDLPSDDGAIRKYIGVRFSAVALMLGHTPTRR